jgi:hypothetical protein
MTYATLLLGRYGMGKITTFIKAVWALIALIKEIKTLWKVVKNIPWGKLKEKFFGKRKGKNESNSDESDNDSTN